jgi:predicted MFS family arabinose efflux permease
MLSADARRILIAQAIRAFAYGFGALLLGTSLERRGFSPQQVGLILGSVTAGVVVAQLVVARAGDRWGRRRSYLVLHLALGLVGIVFATSDTLWPLILVALSGALSTEVIESGPFTSLEQAMLAGELDRNQLAKGFGWYNAIAAAAGSLGALAAGLPDAIRSAWSGAPSDDQWFLLFVPAAAMGAIAAARLSPNVEADLSEKKADNRSVFPRSRSNVLRLGGLFALDSFGGGFTVQAFIVYWLTVRFDASRSVLGLAFFAMGILQTASFLAAPLLAKRFGLLQTMVFTHLPSNVLLAAVAFAPTLPIAIGLLLARVSLSQMDVPTRQAYVMGLVLPEERTAAAAFTNTARYVVRPLGPTLAGLAQSLAIGLPFVAAGLIKIVYDLTLWQWFRRVPLNDNPDSDMIAGG